MASVPKFGSQDGGASVAPVVGVRLDVAARPSPGLGRRPSPREHRLSILAEFGDAVAGAASPSDVVEALVRVLVEHLADWAVPVPFGSRERREPVPLFVTPQTREAVFGPGPAPHDLELVPGGVLDRLPLFEPFWACGEALRLHGSGGPFELPGAEVGGAVLGGARLRYGAILFGRCAEGRGFDPDERDLIGRIAAKTSAALENATLVQEARRAARVRDAVVGMVVHDLATPLNTLELVSGRMMRASAAADPAEALAGFAETARRAVRQIRSLLSDLGDLRDMEQGMFSAHLSSQPVCHILTAVVERVNSLAAMRRVEVELSTRACPLQVMADPARTIQCLANLLTRAIDVSPAGEKVRLVPRRAGDRAEIDVVDRGPGIPADRLPYLFDRHAWARGHDGSRRRLGLTIAQAIAVAHGEPLRVDTEEGRGTRFTLSLALAPSRPGDGGERGGSDASSEAHTASE